MTHWLLLSLAIVLEVAGTTCMKLSDGFSKTLPSVMLFVLYALSFTAMTLALKKLDLSLAYAVWAGVGTALVAVIGIIWFKEPATMIKLGSIGLIIIGVAGLHLSGSAH